MSIDYKNPWDDKDKMIIMLKSALEQLVELKEMKDMVGKTDEYKARQPVAWATAKRLVVQFKHYGVIA